MGNGEVKESDMRGLSVDSSKKTAPYRTKWQSLFTAAECSQLAC